MACIFRFNSVFYATESRLGPGKRGGGGKESPPFGGQQSVHPDIALSLSEGLQLREEEVHQGTLTFWVVPAVSWRGAGVLQKKSRLEPVLGVLPNKRFKHLTLSCSPCDHSSVMSFQ